MVNSAPVSVSTQLAPCTALNNPTYQQAPLGAQGTKMKAFIFQKFPAPPSQWGECEEVVILAEAEDQAWELLAQHNAVGFRCKDWTLDEVKPIAPGVLFSTSYTIGF